MDFVPDGWLKELMEDVQSFDFSRRSMFAGSLDALMEHVKADTPDISNGEVTLNIESTYKRMLNSLQQILLKFTYKYILTALKF